MIENEVIKCNAAVVLVLDESSLTDDIEIPKSIPVLTIHTNEIGYWRCLNLALLHISGDQPFLYTADDILPTEGWLTTAMEEWKEHIPKGIGLACLNDGFVKDASCGHGITTKNYLTVLYDKPEFPPQFEHLYLDTLTSDRAKEIGAYVFCEKAEVNHQHPIIGNITADIVSIKNNGRSIGDKDRKDIMDIFWIKRDKENALRRKSEILEMLED